MTNNLKALKRDSNTTGDIKVLRSKGMIPAILYGGKSPNQKLSIEEKSFNNIFKSDTFLLSFLMFFLCLDLKIFR